MASNTSSNKGKEKQEFKKKIASYVPGAKPSPWVEKYFGKGAEEQYEEYANMPSYYTGYPKTVKRWRIIYQNYNMSLEETYFFLLNLVKDFGFYRIEKISDVFAASEMSSFFGVAQQRLSIQQEKVSQYLATIGKMVKELFQLIREMRILKERLSLYEDSYNTTNKKKSQAAEITLKGIWIDLVEGGAKNPASVYGMARELGFATLPDLFFATPPIKSDEVDEVVDKEFGGFNRKVREVLKRKLMTFLKWKEHTYEELKTRKRFMLKYIRQHYDAIKLYLDWVKPYLRNIKRLQLNPSLMEKPELVSAFETSALEIELLCIHHNGKRIRRLVKSDKGQEVKEEKLNPVLVLTFNYSTQPRMSYVQEGYQRGPIHVGQVEINFRTYAWTDEEIEKYKKMREEEDLQLLSTIDESIKSAMDELGTELVEYLKEAGEVIEKEYENGEAGLEHKSKKPISDSFPLLLVFKAIPELVSPIFGVVFGPLTKKDKVTKQEKEIEWEFNNAKSGIAKTIKGITFQIYKAYKKAHGMLQW